MKKRQLLGIIVMALILVTVPLIAACAKPAPAQVLKIGNTVPMQAKEGIQIKNWLGLLAEQLNQSGGLVVKGQRYNIEIISYDDQYSADAGRAAAERLIYQDKVKYILCQWASAPIIATLGVAEPNKVLMISDGMTEASLDPKYHYFFRAPSLFWIAGQEEAWLENFKQRGLPMTVVLTAPDDETGRGSAAKSAAKYKNLGIQVLDTLYYKRDTTDFSPFATKIKSINPGFVDTGPAPAGALTLLQAKALYEVGYKGGEIFNNMADTWKEIVDKVSPAAIEGAVGGFKDPRLYRTEKWVLDLCNAYEKKYGTWETDAVNWIAGWFVFVAAVKKADSLEVDDLVKAMEGLQVDCLDFQRKFMARPDLNNTRACDSVSEQAPGIIKSGKFQVLKMVSIDDNYKATIKAFALQDVYKLK
jgi:branched-chain amino acid transport system substrate-binding protein